MNKRGLFKLMFLRFWNMILESDNSFEDPLCCVTSWWTGGKRHPNCGRTHLVDDSILSHEGN